jgi:F-type H+-transporting ATPase subunit b
MDLLTPGTGLIVWQAIVFALLFLFLSKFAWKPILEALKERETSIQSALDSAEQAKMEMQQLKAANEEILKTAREERDKILKEARVAAQRINEEAKVEAGKQVDKMLAEARQSIQTEKQAALTQIKVQVAELALLISEKLIRKNLSEDKAQQELVQTYIKELKLN